MSRAGFTLLESLIALVVVTMAVTMLARAHVQALRAEAMSQTLEGARLRMETVVSSVMLGSDPRTVIEDAKEDGWVVRTEPVLNDAGSAKWQSWTVADSNTPAAAVVVYMRIRATKQTP